MDRIISKLDRRLRGSFATTNGFAQFLNNTEGLARKMAFDLKQIEELDKNASEPRIKAYVEQLANNIKKELPSEANRLLAQQLAA